MTVSIIIPALNEEQRIGSLLRGLNALQGPCEIIVVDGQSDDQTAAIARAHGAHVIQSHRGRGTQMHAGAALATGDALWFLHADSTPHPLALQSIRQALANPAIIAGNFTLLFDGAKQMTRIYALLGRLGLSYGDAGIFVRRSVYQAIGGFRQIRLFEDVDLIRRLKSHGRFQTLACPLSTSSRRFEQTYPRTWALWITLQLLYWAGVSPDWLARWYRPAR